MIVITGATGFIGSALIWELNQAGYKDIYLVDQLGSESKWLNIRNRDFQDVIAINDIWQWLEKPYGKIDAIFHMGACSTTTEEDADYLIRNNFHYSQKLAMHCAEKGIPFIYASSAATYGMGELGYEDTHNSMHQLRPINKYGYSKYLFDRWMLKPSKKPRLWLGFKFFNVYGPGEYHKGSQASVVLHAFNQIQHNGSVKLFKSHRDDYQDGLQMRDFIYVKDIVRVMRELAFAESAPESGIYNLGTGQSRSFLDLAHATFNAMDKKPEIEFIPMPENLRDQYQYFTEAHMSKLNEQYTQLNTTLNFCSLEDGVQDYVQNYLSSSHRYL